MIMLVGIWSGLLSIVSNTGPGDVLIGILFIITGMFIGILFMNIGLSKTKQDTKEEKDDND